MKLTRRSFVAASAAAAAALALAGCQSETQVSKTGEAAGIPGVTVDPEFDPEVGAEWIPIVCNANCGGFCENKVLVKDGVVLRQKTDDTTQDSWESPQLRSCPRGRSKQQDTFSADRLKYPMKRKGWSADAPNGELRGVDEWERISWDEAYKIIAEQVRKSIDAYGNRSIPISCYPP